MVAANVRDFHVVFCFFSLSEQRQAGTESQFDPKWPAVPSPEVKTTAVTFHVVSKITHDAAAVLGACFKGLVVVYSLWTKQLLVKLGQVKAWTKSPKRSWSKPLSSGLWSLVTLHIAIGIVLWVNACFISVLEPNLGSGPCKLQGRGRVLAWPSLLRFRSPRLEWLHG